jgi:hypothetical protein
MRNIVSRFLNCNGPGGAARGRSQAFVLTLALGQCLGPRDAQPDLQTAGCPGLAAAIHTLDRRLTYCRILGTDTINSDYSAVLAEASDGGEGYGFRVVGLFVVKEGAAAPYLLVDTLHPPPNTEYEAQLRYAGPGALVIGTTVGVYRTLRERFSYVVDLAEPRVLQKTKHEPLRVYGVLPGPERSWFLATDDEASTVLIGLGTHDPSGCPRDWHLIDTIGHTPIPIVRHARRDSTRLILETAQDALVLSAMDGRLVERRQSSAAQPPTAPIHLRRLARSPVQSAVVQWQDARGEQHRFLLASGSGSADSGFGFPSAIAEQVDTGFVVHRLPRQDTTLLARHRPDRAADGYDVDYIEIGAFDPVGDRIWLGLTFYDGEGTSGVGGLGYFDLPTRSFHIEHHDSIVEWPVSAIRVERDDVWLGLTYYSEGSGEYGRLVRYNRRNGEWRTLYELDQTIVQIARAGNLLYLATSDGVYSLEGETLMEISARRGAAGERILFCRRHSPPER